MKTAPKLLHVLAGACVLGALGAACDIQKTADQATAKNVLAASMLVTPKVTVYFDSLGIDASIPTLDGGFDGGTFDAGGIVALLDGGVTIPSLNLVTVYFGTRGSSLDVAPTGTEGAVVTLRQAGGGSWPVAEVGGGNYTLFGDDAGFKYVDNATYTFDVVLAGNTYTAELVQAPAQEHISAFHPATNAITLDAGEDFSFTRPDPLSNQDRTLGFVTVFPVDFGGGPGQPTWTNVPQTPLQFVKLALAPNDWKSTLVVVPGSAFPQPGGVYIIVFQSAKLGGPKSSNLFIGSAILAGTSEIGVVKTAP